MAPLPDTNTGRAWIDYHTGGGVTSQQHSVMIRFNTDTGGNFAGALSVLGLILTSVGAGNYFTGWQADSARYALPGSAISLPAPLPAGLASFVGTGQAVATLAEQAREVKFVGRGPFTGRKVNFSLYGLNNAQFAAADFRIDRSAENFVGDVLDVIEEMDTGYLVTIGLDRATYYEYANWQYNSYWEGELRT